MNWKRTYHPSEREGVNSRAKKGLVSLTVSPDCALGLKPDLWVAQAHLPYCASVSDRIIPGRKAAEKIAEGLVAELLLGSYLAIVKEMKLHGIELPDTKD